MSSPSNLCERVAAALTDAGVEADRAVVVGCSGGPDSVALAHIVMELAKAGRIGAVTLVYVDHGLRPNTVHEGRAVQELASTGGAQARVVSVHVPARASLEDAARQVRHAALDEIAESLDAVIALAHTASDQAETVLMRILRGTGVVGLAAIPAKRDRIVRPMLRIWRQEVLAYVRDRQLATVDDPMNQDHRFLRARIRHHVLPVLRDENPAIDQALVRLADAAREHRDMIDAAAESLLPAGLPGTMMLIEVAALNAAPRATAKRALAIAAERAGGDPLEAAHLDALIELAAREEAGTVTLSLPGLEVSRIYGSLRLGSPSPEPLSAIEVRGVDGPFEVRPWLPGDRMRPMRLKGRSRKLSDLYTDAKLPREHRRTARVVISSADGVILWAEYIGSAWESAIDVVLTPAVPVASNKH